MFQFTQDPLSYLAVKTQDRYTQPTRRANPQQPRNLRSIKADVSHAAYRMGILEMTRQAVTWFITAYIFLASPSTKAPMGGCRRLGGWGSKMAASAGKDETRLGIFLVKYLVSS